MSQCDNQYSKLRWILTIAGLSMYMVDICTDIRLAVKYFEDQHYIWCGLTLTFVLAGLLVTQIFSAAWYCDDMNDVLMNPEGRAYTSGMSKRLIVVLHVFGLGVFTRFYHLLKRGFNVVWRTNHSTAEEMRKVHHKLFCMATDLSMLKLFEAFLESVPQLLLQLYILLSHDKNSFFQYLSVALSCFNVAWALVDYRRCLRRSLPHITEMPSGTPTAIYLLYKLCSITSLILSYSLLLTISTYSAIAFAVSWLLGTIWTHILKTNFCSTRGLELVYRAVIGVILTFTFFNVKGQGTKRAMIVYYSIQTIIHFTALLLMSLLMPKLWTRPVFLTFSSVIVAGSALGPVCLALYYYLLHPRGKCRVAEEVDGLGMETEDKRRVKNFLQP